ncbi:hypothetical protein [Rhodovulum sp.]|uniref:hypothetical protein n=1 Tax=Rhodovulum sp. TaxID=34009 RepID=UPI001840E65F|nr:hypothetical protein [Rhodovulum sp.]HDR27333.1 hypothetical protein [Rhodovulum sp.]
MDVVLAMDLPFAAGSARPCPSDAAEAIPFPVDGLRPDAEDAGTRPEERPARQARHRRIVGQSPAFRPFAGFVDRQTAAVIASIDRNPILVKRPALSCDNGPHDGNRAIDGQCAAARAVEGGGFREFHDFGGHGNHGGQRALLRMSAAAHQQRHPRNKADLSSRHAPPP